MVNNRGELRHVVEFWPFSVSVGIVQALAFTLRLWPC